MGKKMYKLIVLFVILALFLGLFHTGKIEAAKKKSKTSITVSTQEELVKALKSGKYKKITIKTDAKVSFTLAAKYSNSDLKIVVDAKNATFNSKGKVGSLVVNEAKTVKEYASGNNITVNDEKLTFKAMGGASVEKLKVASETGEVKVINNGEIGRIDITGESKIAVEQNGSVGRLYVAAAVEIGVTGTSEEKLAVTVKSEAAGAAVKSEIPVKVNAYGDVDLQLKKGAENSAVTLKNGDAGVKLENNTDKKVTVTDSDGEKQTVKKGEDLTSDNYVGKPEETDDGTEGETSGTPSDDTNADKKEDENKEEEKKKDENKKEENKDDTTSTGGDEGGSPQGGNYISDPPKAEWGTPVYVWINDNTKITATLPCTNKVLNDIVETVDVTITGTTVSTCTDKGSILYTSKAFSNPAFQVQTKTVETDALGHDWGGVTYTWSEDNKKVTATRICTRNQSHIETETVDAEVTGTTDATCTGKGSVVYTSKAFSNAAFQVQSKTVETDALGHDWGEVTYTWSEDNKKVTATRTCTRNQSHIETETVDAEVTGTTVSTCTDKGSILYTSKAFSNPAFQIQTKTVETDVLGHDWGEVTYTWSEDNKKVTATRTCSRDQSHIETETVDSEITGTTGATCTDKGSIVYTSKAFENAAFQVQTKTVETDALGHDWGEVTYTWSENKTNVTAKHICAHNSSHIETEIAEVIPEITKQAKCEETGEISYTANFNNPQFGTWTKKETLPSLGHNYSLVEEGMPKPIFVESMDVEGYLECTGWEKGINTYVCLNDSNHSYTEEIKVPLAIVADEPEDGIYKIDGSNITIDLGKKLERYNEAYGYQASWVEAFGNQTIGEYIYSLSVFPYNDELKQWWIHTEPLDEEGFKKQIAMYEFIGDGIGEFLFENENDADTVINDILYTGETVTYNINYVPNNEAVFEKLEITVTFILPVIGFVIIG